MFVFGKPFAVALGVAALPQPEARPAVQPAIIQDEAVTPEPAAPPLRPLPRPPAGSSMPN